MLKQDLKKLPRLLLGLTLLGLAIVILKDCRVGLAPWNTFHYGLHKKFGIQYGTAGQLVGIVIIIITCFMKLYPGIGTILNVFWIGTVINIVDSSGIIRIPENYIIRVFIYVFFVFVLSYGIYLYLSCYIGAGPRDGLMVALVDITKGRVFIVKCTMELIALSMGMLLGVMPGIGTIISVFGVPYFISKIFKVKNFVSKRELQHTIPDYFKKEN